MTLAAALNLAAQGFHVFPLRRGNKKPVHAGWQMKATTDPDAIRNLWRARDYNVGIYASRFGADKALLIVDVDSPGHGTGKKDGFRTLVEHELEGRDFPLTLEHGTPTGGRHLVYMVDQPVRQGVDVLGSGLDVRSHGGYVVGPGSKVEAGTYFVDRPALPVPAPTWLVDKCGEPRAVAADRTPLSGIDPERAQQRAIAYLETAPRSVKGAGGDQCAYTVAAALMDFGLDQAATLDLMLSEHWDEGCGWTPARLAEKVAHAARYMQQPRGSKAPEAVFEAVEMPAKKELHPFDKLNREWSLVMTGGGHHLLWETTDFKGNPMVEHVKEGSFHKYHAAKEIQIGKKTEKLTEAWMASPRRRTYDGLVFAPQQEVSARWYNLWRGFSYKPSATARPRAAAAVQAWIDHCTNNIAQGDPQLARWFIGYMAHIVQKPYEKPLVAVVLKGRKGTGKNAAIERVGALFHRNMVVADDDRYLIGNFNSHLESCLLLALDEASWAGSKKVEGKLKGIITGANHMIERKGMEPYQVANLTRVFILGNEAYLVPATQDERRYAVFDMGEAAMQDREFFREMREGMEANGGEGYGLLLHYLQMFDLTGIDVNDAPKTQGLANQKIENLSPLHAWWMDCLLEGQVLGTDFTGEWPARMPTNRLQQAFQRHARDRGVRGWLPARKAFNEGMAEIMPGWCASKSTKHTEGDSTYHYALPPLGDARNAMSRFCGKDNLWEDL